MGCLLGRITRRAQPRRLQWLGMMAFCLSSVSMTRPAAAQATTRPTARGYLEHGLRLYGDGQYDAAIRELRLGYALEPLPQILYTLGQAERKLGRCDQAIGYYKEYLRSADATSAGAARFQIERCEQQQRDAAAAAAARAPAPTPVAAPAPAVTVAATPPPPRRPVYRDWVGMTLTSVGGAAALTGGGLLVGSVVEVQRSRTSFDQFNSTLSGAETLRTTGIVLAATGGALAIAGVIRLSLLARARRAPASGGR